MYYITVVLNSSYSDIIYIIIHTIILIIVTHYNMYKHPLHSQNYYSFLCLLANYKVTAIIIVCIKLLLIIPYSRLIHNNQYYIKWEIVLISYIPKHYIDTN